MYKLSTLYDLVHDRTKLANKGGLKFPRLMLTNTRFVMQKILVKYEIENAPFLHELCRIHDRECDRMKLASMGELKLQMLMLSNT